MRFDLKPSKVDERKIKNSCDKLKPLINEIRQTVNQGGYKTKYAPLNLVDDKQLVREVKKKSRAKSLILVGIGGSNLGTKAVQEAVKNCKVFYADTVDPAKMKDILDNLPNKSILNIVSESGTTTETIANAEILLKHHKGEVAVTTRKESPLWKIAEKKGWQKLEVPNTIGGRYSVLSAVGLFPLSVLGIDIDALIRGAKKTRDESLKYNSAAAKTAAILYSHMKKRPIHDTFLFSTMLENLGKWYRQLMAESLGKNNKGMTPTISIGSTDLHSMVQLNLGGPDDKFTTFVTLKRDTNIIVPKLNLDLAPVEGKTLHEIRKAIQNGTIKAYEQKKRPFVKIELDDRSEKPIGEFLQFKMIETIYLAKLMNVNPFDQPNVEEYKAHTRKILNHEEKQ